MRAATRMFRGADAKIGSECENRIVKTIRLNFCDFPRGDSEEEEEATAASSVSRVCDCASDKKNRSNVVAA